MEEGDTELTVVGSNGVSTLEGGHGTDTELTALEILACLRRRMVQIPSSLLYEITTVRLLSVTKFLLRY
jgi:hypothetical protein